jgi:hypothetical protein
MRQSFAYLNTVENPQLSNPDSDREDIIMLFVGVAKYFHRNWRQKQNYNWVIELK